MRNVLKLNHSGFIDSYWFYADLLAIASTVDADDAWLLNNYINLRSVESASYPFSLHFMNGPYFNLMVDYLKCPFLKTERLRKDVEFNPSRELVACLKALIDSGSYIILMVERREIETYQINRSRPSPHEIMIYGYDDATETIYFADNTKTGKYAAKLSCSYASLRNAYLKLNIPEERELHAYFYKIQVHACSTYSVQRSTIKAQLADYLHGRSSVEPYTTEKVFYGIYIFDRFLAYLTLHLKEGFVLDLRHFSLFYDHKKVMCERIRRLLPDLKTEYRYEEVVKEALLIRNLMLKYRMSKEKTILLRTMRKMEALKSKEQAILESACVALD
ncbi:hypothetical protein IDH44_22995 [Paenibacillus sp. IB182496]|uniref:Butirosin biosynthesis protein H N-terminal domain-containing protein n=1 Tax=Paenibacillus sabuli TaxID=2772509 RepID=A0A927BYZ0_9BACL|nr:hypothetical protein [Paenibacillus sabuli]MBD2848074.1 hypothetical protein [Paenibacillus sabuli]